MHMKKTDDDTRCDHGLTRGTGFGSPQDKETDRSPVVLHFLASGTVASAKDVLWGTRLC